MRRWIAIEYDVPQEVRQGPVAECDPVILLAELSAETGIAVQRGHVGIPGHHPLCRAAPAQRSSLAEFPVDGIGVIEVSEIQRIVLRRQDHGPASSSSPRCAAVTSTASRPGMR